NKSFLSFQGYVDWQFGGDEDMGNEFVPMTDNGGAAFFGLYWHTDNYALGYGLKGFKDVYLLKDGAGIVGLETTGWGHYLTATYKF
uniref:outer membrane protein OmpK n=1 Tax=Shewanella sp. TaxID=50422 RepID=UPI003D0EE28E